MNTTSDFRSTLSKPTSAATAAAGNGSRPGDTLGARLKRSVAVRGMLAYPSLVEVSEQSGKFDAILIVDPAEPTLAGLRELVGDHAQALCGQRELPQRYHNPLRNGDEPSMTGAGFALKHDAFRGKIFFRAKSAFPPKCVWGPRREACDPSQLRGGDEVFMEVGCFGFNNQSAGVGLSLNALWLIRKGTETIERGAAGGSTFASLDPSKIGFDVPGENHADETASD